MDKVISIHTAAFIRYRGRVICHFPVLFFSPQFLPSEDSLSVIMAPPLYCINSVLHSLVQILQQLETAGNTIKLSLGI